MKSTYEKSLECSPIYDSRWLALGLWVGRLMSKPKPISLSGVCLQRTEWLLLHTTWKPLLCGLLCRNGEMANRQKCNGTVWILFFHTLNSKVYCTQMCSNVPFLYTMFSNAFQELHFLMWSWLNISWYRSIDKLTCSAEPLWYSKTSSKYSHLR